ARGSRAERDTVALTMLAAVADGYFQVLAFREREAVAASNLDAARRVLDAVQRRFDAGSVGPLDVATQRAAVGEAQIAVSELQQ
ncbi:TolC family protein, partial [Staphylococcus equorum]|uniref:TolC family protein n=1 Tax=Staphylococcus equorum TaxID=246432 RepID=UPI0022AED02E